MKSIFLSDRKKKHISWFLLIIFLQQILIQNALFAKGGGPSQPELQSFEPVNNSKLVDLATGNFNYNIPLMAVDGYPLNIFYRSGITMDQESSCVGLGWNFNPGSINRTIRGLPDDFAGDKITKEMKMKEDITFGIKGGIAGEVFGFSKVNMGVDGGWFYNNYRGLGLEFGLSTGLNVTSKAQDKRCLGLGAGVNVNVNSQTGVSCDLGISPIISYNCRATKQMDIQQTGISGGIGFNSRTGLTQGHLNVDFRKYVPNTGNKFVDNLPLVGKAVYSFAVPSCSPSMDFPRKSFAISFRGTIGSAVYGVHPGIRLTGYYTQLSLSDEIFTSDGFGTLYLDKGTSGNSVLDFNREKDGPYTPYIHNLPILIPTPDIYSVSGQGIGGSFLLKRGDCGVFHDRHISSKSESGNISLELGFGSVFHGGVDLEVVDNKNIVDKWSTNNNLNNFFEFKPHDIQYTDIEGAYFKQAGELTAESDIDLFHNLQDYEPISPIIDNSTPFNFGVKGDKIRKGTANDEVIIGPAMHSYREKREKRNQNISFLTANDAAHVGESFNINSYPLYSTSNAYSKNIYPENSISRVIYPRQPHHLSEISVIGADGKRYVYGIPAYNITQEEYLFSVDGTTANENGMIKYSHCENCSNNDDSRNNNKGQDKFFLKETTPPYAHSYLLTSVLSQDYEDADEYPGPSQGDMGGYTLIKYHKMGNDYIWRSPLYNCSTGLPNDPHPNADPYANFNEGLYSTPDDNKGSYVYGSKEYWYVSSIEGKTQIAQFYYSLREDGLPVITNSGNHLNTNEAYRLLKLDSIRLMSKNDIDGYDQLNSSTIPVPIVTVVFDYGYSLCTGVPNTIDPPVTGKLTLMGLYFKYGKSCQGKKSWYKFTYGKGEFANPSYCQRSLSRWGGYQEYNSVLGDLYPYVVQDKAKQDKYANAWNLTRIDLPTGGFVEVDYESNDYAFVQNKPAMEMVNIIGFGKNNNCNLRSRFLYDYTNSYDYVFFNLKEAGISDYVFLRDYIEDLKEGNLYFKCMVNLTEVKSDIIHGYTKIKEAGICPDDNTIGYIKLKGADFTSLIGTAINPIAKSAWQFIRISRPELITPIWGAVNLNGTSGGFDPFLQVARSVAGLASAIGEFSGGPNVYLYKHNFACSADLGKCWMRLYEPCGHKLAGGARVKRIIIGDNWNKMAGYPAGNTYEGTKYGQDYDYSTTTKVINSNNEFVDKLISSGVASYEPIVGCDENPFKQPEFYNEEHLLAPDNRFYQENPAGESFFPAPQIIYSKVTVKNLKFDNQGSLYQGNYTSTGYSVNEFYTAFDFPTILKETRLDKQKKKTSLVFSLLKANIKDHMAASQGFYVEVNNMAGQPKSQWEFDNSGSKVSGVEYFYKKAGNKLENNVKVIEANGQITEQLLGVDFMVAADSRESKTKTISPGVSLNIEGFIAGIIPIITGIPIPLFEMEETMFRSMSISKFVQRTGILQKTVAYDASSIITTENLAFDGTTGEVLLTQTMNEFGDPIYNLKLPAHFFYIGMDNACQNINITENGYLSGFDFIFDDHNLLPYFYPGDELSIYKLNDNQFIAKAWVVGKTNQSIIICGKTGEPVDGSNLGNVRLLVKIIRSGHRNIATNDIAQYSLTKNPIVGNLLNLDGLNENCINSIVTEYCDKWEWECIESQVNNYYNPFLSGVAGKWRIKRNLSFLEDRTSNYVSNVSGTNIRNTGTINNFTSYFSYNLDNLVKTSDPKWLWFEKVVKYDPNGNVVETMDTLNHFSSSMYNHATGNLICKTANSRYCEMVAFSFEEKELPYDRCFGSGLLPSSSIWHGVEGYSHTGICSKACTNLVTEVFSGWVQSPYNLPKYKEHDNSCNIFPLNNAIPTQSDNYLYLPPFYLYEGKKYKCSAWVKIGDDINTVYESQDEPTLQVKMILADNTFQTIEGHPSGPCIEGWRRIFFDFTVIENYQNIIFNLIKPSEYSKTVYLDDFRIQPYNAEMKTFVYDRRTNKLVAELDENNYATFYEYGAAGQLERVKKETNQGIVTIKEVRFNQSNINNGN